VTRQRALMRLRVDTHCHAAGNDITGRAQGGGEGVRMLTSVDAWMTTAYDRDLRQAKYLDLTEDEEHWWRIGDFAEQRWISRIVECQHMPAACPRPGKPMITLLRGQSRPGPVFQL